MDAGTFLGVLCCAEVMGAETLVHGSFAEMQRLINRLAENGLADTGVDFRLAAAALIDALVAHARRVDDLCLRLRIRGPEVGLHEERAPVLHLLALDAHR